MTIEHTTSLMKLFLSQLAASKSPVDKARESVAIKRKPLAQWYRSVMDVSVTAQLIQQKKQTAATRQNNSMTLLSLLLNHLSDS